MSLSFDQNAAEAFFALFDQCAFISDLITQKNSTCIGDLLIVDGNCILFNLFPCVALALAQSGFYKHS